jgi:hypothetical protein
MVILSTLRFLVKVFFKILFRAVPASGPPGMVILINSAHSGTGNFRFFQAMERPEIPGINLDKPWGD